MNPWDQFTGANAGYVYELFERYQRDPSSVDEATRRAFANWTPRTRHQRRLKPSPPTVWKRPASGHCRIQSRRVDSPLRSPRRRARPARLSRSDWRSVAAAAGARPDRRDTGSACRPRSCRDPRHRAPRMPSRRSPGCARSTAPPPATITTRCSSRTSGCGCATRWSRASSGRPTIRSTAASCSIASPKSRRSSVSCTAPSRQDAVLDRGPRHDGAGPRRDHLRRRRGRRAAR